MILFVYYLKRQLQRQQLLLLVLLSQLSVLQRNFDVSAQWMTVTEFSMRVPGHCMVASGTNSRSRNSQRQLFDCGGSNLLLPQQRRCIPLQHFHDGIVDCPDGSDEFCFPGYVKCGVYCVLLQYATQCFINPTCDNSATSPQFCAVIKRKLCSIDGTVPCKGYGECVMRKWIEKGQTNCIDKSDQDSTYIAIFGIKRGINLYPFAGNITNNLHSMINTGSYVSSWFQLVSPLPPIFNWTNDNDHTSSVLDVTNNWTVVQSTTTKFVFRIPSTSMNGINQTDFTTIMNSNETEHNPDDATTTYQFQLITTSTADLFTADSNVELSQLSFTNDPTDENPTQQILEKFSNTAKEKPSNESEITINQQLKKQQIDEDNLAVNTISDITIGPSSDQLACARYEYAEAQRLVPKPFCTCPPGQMPSGNEYAPCKTTTVSTFGVDVHDMCNGMETALEERSRLALLVLNRTRLPYQACVRRDGNPVMVQLDCSQCTVTEFDEAFKQNSNDHYVPLRITELTFGACLASALNDCDPEHADCLVSGPRYECRCHDGWNDTSKEFGQAEGRRCEQLILLADGCIVFLGHCLFWWLLLFGLILLLIIMLLCWLSNKLHALCWKRRREDIVEEEDHLVISEIGSIKNSNPNLATIESIKMNKITNSSIANDQKALTIVSNSLPSEAQNSHTTKEKVFIKQQSVKSLDDEWKKDDEVKTNDDEKQQEMQLESLERSLYEIKSETEEKSSNSMTKAADISVSLTKKMKKSTSEEEKESNELSLKSEKNTTTMIVSAVPQKSTEKLLKDEKVMKNFENNKSIKSNSKVIMNVSQSLSETSLRTMWELFKQGTWKQSSRPSSVKSSTSSLDRLVDAFLCRKRSKKIHPGVSTTSNSMEYPLDTVKIVDHRVDDISQLPNSTLTTFTTCCNATTVIAPIITTVTNDTISNSVVQLPGEVTDEAPIQTQVLEQKIVTETKTLTTRSTILSVPKEIPLPLKTAATQQPNPITSTAMINRSEFVQHQQPASDAVALNAANEIPQQNDSIDAATIVATTTTAALQHFTVAKNAIVDQDQQPSTIIQIENDVKEQMKVTKPSTTTAVTGSDTQLKRQTGITEPNSSEVCKTQSEDGKQITIIQYDDAEEKPSQIANEMKDALKEITSPKLPTKRLTEEQRKKLNISCGHLHIHGDDKMSRKEGGFIRQLLTTTKHESRRKLSSIKEKSTDMLSVKGQLISASSISCPTTTRINKDHRPVSDRLQTYRDSASGTWNSFYADLTAKNQTLNEQQTNINDSTKTIISTGDSTVQSSDKSATLERKSEQNQTSTRMKRRRDARCRHCSTSTAGSQRSCISLPLKNDDPNHLIPLQFAFPHNYQPQKLLQSSYLKGEHAKTSRLRRENLTRYQQDDWNLHDPMVPASHSARLHTRLSSAKALRKSSNIKWTPNASEDESRPAKEQLWWDAH